MCVTVQTEMDKALYTSCLRLVSYQVYLEQSSHDFQRWSVWCLRVSSTVPKIYDQQRGFDIHFVAYTHSSLFSNRKTYINKSNNCQQLCKGVRTGCGRGATNPHYENKIIDTIQKLLEIILGKLSYAKEYLIVVMSAIKFMLKDMSGLAVQQVKEQALTVIILHLDCKYE